MATLKSVGTTVGLLTGAAGVTGGVGYSMGFFDNPKPKTQKISELLDKENKYSLLSTEKNQDTGGWDAAWKQYKNDNKSNTNGKDKWNVEGWKATEDVTKIPEDFKNICSNKKNIEVIDDKSEEYIDFTKYCSRPKTMQEALSKNGFKPLGGTDDEDTKWKERINNYKNSKNQLPKAKVESGASIPDFNVLKNGCTEALKIKTTEDSYSNTISAAKEWCGL